MRLSCKTCSTSGTSWQKILQSYSIFLRIFSCKMKDCLQSSYMTTFQHVTNLQDTVLSEYRLVCGHLERSPTSIIQEQLKNTELVNDEEGEK